MITFYTSRSLC